MQYRSFAATAALLTCALPGCESPTGNPVAVPVLELRAIAERTGVDSEVAADSYYANRLRSAEHAKRSPDGTRLSINEEELAWARTAQDTRAALMVSPDTGFRTWGVETSVAEIPPGWHSGLHRHGEEAIYIVAGRGCILVQGVRYEFDAGTTIGIPYAAEHQLYNTGDDVVRYVSATPFPLERFVGLGAWEQLSEAGRTVALPQVETSEDGLDERGRLIRLFWKDAEYRGVRLGWLERLRARYTAGVWLTRPNTDGKLKAIGREARIATSLGHHGARVGLMNRKHAPRFPNELVLMSGFLIDEPGTHSGRHAHMDAILYVVRGSGYSVIGGKRVEWRPGTSLHVPGPRTEHQHFNTGDEPAFLLRIASGLRPALEHAVRETLPYLWFEARGTIGPTTRARARSR